MTDPRAEVEQTLTEMERADPFQPHDLGCRCYPHVSQRAAIEAATQAATAEYREGLRRLARPAPPSEGLDVERLARVLSALLDAVSKGMIGYEWYRTPEAAAGVIAREYAALTPADPSASENR